MLKYIMKMLICAVALLCFSGAQDTAEVHAKKDKQTGNKKKKVKKLKGPRSEMQGVDIGKKSGKKDKKGEEKKKAEEEVTAAGSEPVSDSAVDSSEGEVKKKSKKDKKDKKKKKVEEVQSSEGEASPAAEETAPAAEEAAPEAAPEVSSDE